MIENTLTVAFSKLNDLKLRFFMFVLISEYRVFISKFHTLSLSLSLSLSLCIINLRTHVQEAILSVIRNSHVFEETAKRGV